MKLRHCLTWLFCFTLGSFLPFSLQSQNPPIDSLKMEIDQTADSPEKVEGLIGLVNQLNSIDLEKGIVFGREAIRLAESIQDETALTSAQLALGRTFANYGELDSALGYFQKAKTLAMRLNNLHLLGNSYTKLNYVFVYNGQIDSALFYGIEALKLYEEMGDPLGTSIANQTVADALGKQERYEEALPYALDGVAKAEEAKDSAEIATACKHVSFLYIWLKDYEKALLYSERSIAISKQMGDDFSLAIAYFDRGNVYKNIADWDAAIKDYSTALRLVENIDYQQFKGYLYESLGYCYLQKGEFAKGVPMALKGMEIKRELGNRSDLLEPLLFLSEAYSEMNQYDSAYALLTEYLEVKDSVYQIETEQQMDQIRTEYETEKIANKNQTLQAEKDRQTSFLVVAVFVILVIGILAGALGWSNQQRKAANHTLVGQKQEIEQKNQQNEVLLKEIHHRVKNNLQVISSLLRLQSAQISDEVVREAVESGESRVKSMALIHQKLYQRENLAGIEMKDYFSNLGQDLMDSLGRGNQDIELEIDMEPLEIDVDTAIPLGLITNELVTNSLKYAFPDQRAGRISISLKETDENKLELTVRDNGVGEADTSDNKESTSFGSQLISLLSMQLGGKLTTEINEGRTTRLVISNFQQIPIA